MILYPCTGADTGSQDTLNRVYHSSDTRRFLGLNRPTAAEKGSGSTTQSADTVTCSVLFTHQESMMHHHFYPLGQKGQCPPALCYLAEPVALRGEEAKVRFSERTSSLRIIELNSIIQASNTSFYHVYLPHRQRLPSMTCVNLPHLCARSR